jgi:hypothetical protein
MEIRVMTVKENEDGSADVDVKFDEEGLHFLIQEGLSAILKQAVDMARENNG